MFFRICKITGQADIHPFITVLVISFMKQAPNVFSSFKSFPTQAFLANTLFNSQLHALSTGLMCTRHIHSHSHTRTRSFTFNLAQIDIVTRSVIHSLSLTCSHTRTRTLMLIQTHTPLLMLTHPRTHTHTHARTVL